MVLESRELFMYYKLGIRREDKNKWEARVPIIPEIYNPILDELEKMEIGFVEKVSLI